MDQRFCEKMAKTIATDSPDPDDTADR